MDAGFDALAGHDALVYGNEDCPRCEEVVLWYMSRGIPVRYEDYANLAASPDRCDIMAALEMMDWDRSLPIIVVGRCEEVMTYATWWKSWH